MFCLSSVARLPHVWPLATGKSSKTRYSSTRDFLCLVVLIMVLGGIMDKIDMDGSTFRNPPSHHYTEVEQKFWGECMFCLYITSSCVSFCRILQAKLLQMTVECSCLWSVLNAQAFFCCWLCNKRVPIWVNWVMKYSLGCSIGYVYPYKMC